ncbi:MAG: phage baseplate assembly protein V [Candidatus Zixiibacteriota bacterium]
MPINIDDFDVDVDDDDDDDEIHAKIPAAIELKIDGATIDWTVQSFELDQKAFDHHVLKIYLSKDIPSPDPIEHFKAMNFFPAKMGSSLTLIIKAIDEFTVSDKPNEFFGIITNLRFINNGTQTGQVLVEANSPTWKMDQAALVKIYENQSRADIANAILAKYSTENMVSNGGGAAVSRKFTTQWMQTDWDFLLTTIMGETNRWVYYDGKRIVVDEAKSKDTVKLQLMVNVGSVELRMNATQTKFIEYGWDEEQNAQTSAVKSNSPTSFSGMANHAFGASQNLIVDKSIGLSDLSTKAGDVDSRAEAMQNDAIGELVVCYLQTNQPSIKVGNTIELVGMGPVYNGVYFVKRVTHHIDSGNDYYNYVEALPLESAKPPLVESDARAWRGDPVGAIVVDNNDEEQRGRIKVQFLFNASDGSPATTTWLPVATPYAGADRGFYFMPEIGDEVLVGFFNGDADHPVVLGSLWNGKDKPKGDWITDKNDKKVIYTRSGHQLVFDDTDGSEKISIIDKTGNNSIVIDSAANTITVTAEKDIIFKANGSINMEAKQDFSVTTRSGSVSIKAGKDFSAEAINVNIKAKAKTALEGAAGLEAKGAIVEVTGNGPVTVKGNPIMLN